MRTDKAPLPINLNTNQTDLFRLDTADALFPVLGTPPCCRQSHAEHMHNRHVLNTGSMLAGECQQELERCFV